MLQPMSHFSISLDMPKGRRKTCLSNRGKKEKVVLLREESREGGAAVSVAAFV